MTDILTRAAKGDLLEHFEIDANFTNLNNDKIETSLLGLTEGKIPLLGPGGLFPESVFSSVGGLFTEDASNNIVGGTGSGASLTTGTYNFFAGSNAGNLLQSGRDNIAIGYRSLSVNLVNNNNVAIGSAALRFATGAALTALGPYAGNKISSGSNSIAIGWAALGQIDATSASITGSGNVGMGLYAVGGLSTNPTTLHTNLGVGNYALSDLQTGGFNTGLGTQTLETITTGLGNTAIGDRAGRNLTSSSSYNVMIGFRAGPGTGANVHNKLYIHNNVSSTPLIYGDFAISKITINGDFDVTGAFTSLGIDDNATGERLQIADTLSSFGASGVFYGLIHPANDQGITIAGGNAPAKGGNIELGGGTHVSIAGDIRIRSGANSVFTWDESLGSLTLSTGAGVKTTALTINASQRATFSGDVRLSGDTPTLSINDVVSVSDTAMQTYISLQRAGAEKGWLGFGSGANTHLSIVNNLGEIRLSSNGVTALTLDASQDATFAGAVTVQGVFTSLGIDDNASSERLQIADGDIVLGGWHDANYTVKRGIDNRILIFEGGVTSAGSARLLLYGATETTGAGDFALKSGFNTVCLWDESAGALTLSTGAGAKTAALTLDASQNATFAGTVDGRDVAADGAVLDSLVVTSAPNIPARNAVLNKEPVSQGESTRTGMSSTIYTGTSSANPVASGIDMATGEFGGLVWIKSRNTVSNHALFDTVRGTTLELKSNSSGVEVINSDALTAFTSTGFSLGADANVNSIGNTYIAWSWQTNKKITGVTNRNKSYTCHYNPDMGFSIVSYVGDGVAGHEIPHHLGVSPELSIFKNITSSNNWILQGKDIGNSESGDYILLNATNTLTNTTSVKSIFTEETVSLGIASYNTSGVSNIAYHFSSVEGVSKVGKYIGTGAIGNYVECGFTPAFVMIKNITTAEDWQVLDVIRGGGNLLQANTTSAEQSVVLLTINAQGFILLGSGGTNKLNDEYIFLAFSLATSDATKSWTNYSYPTTADTLSIAQDTLISFAEGFSAVGQTDTQENVGAGVTHTLGVGHENKHYYIYKDKAGAFGVTENRPLEDSDKWGDRSPSDATLRTTSRHFDYESDTGVVLASGENSTNYAYNAFNKDINDIITVGSYWQIASSTISWLQYKQTEKRILKSWRIKAHGDSTELPSRLIIQGSNDGLNWINIDTTYSASNYVGSLLNLWGDLQSTADNTVAYLYHRIYITANNGDPTYTGFSELEFNTILPSDRFDVAEGVLYNSAGSPIARTYLAEFRTDDNGGVINNTIRNFTPAKQKFTEAEIQGKLKVHDEIENRGICTAWVNFDGTQNPPLILDSYNVSDVVDLGVGAYKIIFETPMDLPAYTVAGYAQHAESVTDSSFNIRGYGNSITKQSVTVQSTVVNETSSARTDLGAVCVSIFGGKKIL
ncbi:MAG: hypothetical protein OEX12_00065 [Gammaproteobacteria bacterium]|nr:hypothetical protein [Gammaproteobacteria bacterium]